MEKMKHTTTKREAKRTYSAHFEDEEKNKVLTHPQVLLSSLIQTCLTHPLAPNHFYSLSFTSVSRTVCYYTCLGSLATSATIRTMKLPIATVNNHPACNTAFMLLGALKTQQNDIRNYIKHKEHYTQSLSSTSSTVLHRVHNKPTCE